MRKILLIALLLITGPAHAAESVYDRVMSSSTLRCGYWDWRPLYWHDKDSGQATGIFRDVMAELGRVSGLKIEWTQEVQFAQLVSDLETGKIDAVCAGVWPSAARAKRLLFSDPVFFMPINIYVGAGDTRFDDNTSGLNATGTTIAVMDGEMSTEIRESDFPLSTPLAIPQIAGTGAELLMSVATGKAAATFTDAVAGHEFMSANPNGVKPLTVVRVFPNTIAVRGDEVRLKLFLDQGLQQLENSGVIEKILLKYDPQFPGALLRPTRTYETQP